MYIGTSRVTSKGQLTIPNEIRKKRGLSDGMKVIVIDTEAGVLVKKASDLKEIFAPFEEIAKKEKLNRGKLAGEIQAEKLRTLGLFRK
ncbi:MAG: AbrB/MazE/SpoVT family DNA-binding domain-containing protein [Candidatus Diapherotrites archaeon]|uniref:AbrB/MazE/SpoVT family DNA-binding domain-containing protein n=1 Tax=Candidatus Iainarchaeum sp. TaxID=3101447 RepID=A0A8T3YLR7_9ARCH|nr:AbrB/MazE/SpoVT family DNA-binding domain-containing protein [Candidatus Diapherotrites archaeon]